MLCKMITRYKKRKRGNLVRDIVSHEYVLSELKQLNSNSTA